MSEFIEDGYPTNKALNLIEKWDFQKDNICYFLEFIEKCWNYADCGGYVRTGKWVINLKLHTFGWSGNEDIIRAMMRNKVFWFMCWHKSVRGGHYWFIIKTKSWEGK